MKYRIANVLLALTICGCGANSPGASVAADAAIATPDAPAIAPPPTIGTADMRTFHEIEIDGVNLPYAVVLPSGFDTAETYPILLAMPPGEQVRQLADAALDLYWDEKARELGWIVISPIATELGAYDSGSEALIEPFLERLATVYRPENGKYHIAGPSMGGVTTFRIAGQHPGLFASMIAMPGFATTSGDIANLSKLTHIPIHLFVGRQDAQAWIDGAHATESTLKDLNGIVSLEVLPDDGHLIQSISSDMLFELLNDAR